MIVVVKGGIAVYGMFPTEEKAEIWATQKKKWNADEIEVLPVIQLIGECGFEYCEAD